MEYDTGIKFSALFPPSSPALVLKVVLALTLGVQQSSLRAAAGTRQVRGVPFPTPCLILNAPFGNNLLPGRGEFSFPGSHQICLTSISCRCKAALEAIHPPKPGPFAMSLSCFHPAPTGTCRKPLQKVLSTSHPSLSPVHSPRPVHFPTLPHARHRASRCWVLLIPLPSFLSAPYISLRLNQACLTAAARCGDPIHLLQKNKKERRKKIIARGDSCLHVKHGLQPSVCSEATGPLLEVWELDSLCPQKTQSSVFTPKETLL